MESDSHLSNQPHRLNGRTISVLVFLLVLLIVCSWCFWPRGDTAERARQLLLSAQVQLEAEDFARAEKLACEALALFPGLSDATFVAADCAFAEQRYSDALKYLNDAEVLSTADGIPDQTDAQLAAMSGDLLHYHLHRFMDAEAAYRRSLSIDRTGHRANDGLARLLGLCARRHEAIQPILQLIKDGEDTDLLILLTQESGVLRNDEMLDAVERVNPDDANFRLARARLLGEAQQTNQAIEILKRLVMTSPEFSPAWAELMRLLVVAGDTAELAEWANRLPTDTSRFPEYWLARAHIAEESDDVSGAVRCYWELLGRRPESKLATYRLAHLLRRVDAPEASLFEARLEKLHSFESVQRRAFDSSRRSGVDDIVDLVVEAHEVGRLWEALALARLAASLDAHSESHRELLMTVQRDVSALPLELTSPAFNPRETIDLSRFPLPSGFTGSTTPTALESLQRTAATFRNDAATAGVHFTFRNHTQGSAERRMFEFTGGGIGVLDLDIDGFPDLVCAQGLDQPTSVVPASATSPRDVLFRNLDGKRFEVVTDHAGFDESISGIEFGQGVTIGDYNADGFPDIYIANIGRNALWLNNGDGTLTSVTIESTDASWTTSCLLADLNGDSLPDIYDVNYLAAPDLFDRICHHPDGSRSLCMPMDFSGAADRILLNDGTGQFVDGAHRVEGCDVPGPGLGIAAFDAVGNGRLSVFVANDTTPNFFLVPDDENRAGTFAMAEQGIVSGLALNADGKAEGCMGIAVGDVDGDGRLDLHVTNFLAESNTLYQQQEFRTFEDRSRHIGLSDLTYHVLGFGTQFLDANRDGILELFVANGHIDDLTATGRPYRMSPQLLHWDGVKFSMQSAQGTGEYFEQKWLGRSVVLLDWNRDGLCDVLVGHLDDAYALLTSTTANAGSGLTLRLIGVSSNRDAIGTTVEARVGDRLLVRQLTAGDGYMASNERKIIIGTGQSNRIDLLTVRWPSGAVQEFRDVPAAGEIWLREGDDLRSSERATPTLDLPSRSAH